MKTSPARRKPKTNPNEDLETISRTKLYNCFKVSDFEMRSITHRDKGVDVVIELKEPGQYSGIEFVVQLKATQKANAKSIYNRKIQTTNIEYLFSHMQISLYILYVIEEDRFYFEWTDDFLRTIWNKVPDKSWRDQASHTLSFSKVLNEVAVQHIYTTVLENGEEHKRQKERAIENGLLDFVDIVHDSKEITSIHERKHSHVLHTLKYLFDTFVGLSVLPIHIIVRLPPFALSKNSNTYYEESSFTLYTDNPKLFQFFDNLSTSGTQIVLKSKDEEIDKIKDSKKLITQAVNFCQHNNIHHIRLLPKGDQRICVHNLYVSRQCHCERCRYYKLDLQGAIEVIAKGKPRGPYENLRRAHILMKLGRFKQAFELYNKLAEKYLKERKFVSYFICKYNLAKSNNLFRWNYFGSDQSKILKTIKGINLEEELYLLQKKHKVSEEIMLVLRWINQNNFINFSYKEMDSKLSEIASTYRSDQHGGWTSVDHSTGIGYQLNELAGFVESNLLMDETFYGFSEGVLKSLEGMVMLLNLSNEKNARMKGLDYYTIRVMTLYGDASKINAILEKYKTESILETNSGEGSQSRFPVLIRNFINSLDVLATQADPDSKPVNHFLFQKVNGILKTLSVFLSVVKLKKADLNSFYDQLLSKAKSHKVIQQNTIAYFGYIIARRYKDIDIALIERTYRLAFEDSKFDTGQFKTAIPRILKTLNDSYTLPDGDAISVMRRTTGTTPEQFDIEALVALWPIASIERQAEISNAITQSLDARFYYEDYFRASIKGIVDYRPYFEEFLSSVPETEREQKMDGMFHRGKKLRNTRLNYLADLAFKFGLDLKEARYQKLLPPGELYFEWLFNIESFDYQKFNPAWILEFHSNIYFREFKKIPQIHESIKRTLEEKPKEGLIKIYLKYFV